MKREICNYKSHHSKARIETTLKPFDIHSENNELCDALQKFWNIEEYERTHLCHSQIVESSWKTLISMRMNEDTKSACHGRKVLFLLQRSTNCVIEIETAALATEEKQRTVERLFMWSRMKPNLELSRPYENTTTTKLRYISYVSMA